MAGSRVINLRTAGSGPCGLPQPAGPSSKRPSPPGGRRRTSPGEIPPHDDGVRNGPSFLRPTTCIYRRIPMLDVIAALTASAVLVIFLIMLIGAASVRP